MFRRIICQFQTCNVWHCPSSKYLFDSNLNESRKSAYTTGHNTETTLILVKNDIMVSIWSV